MGDYLNIIYHYLYLYCKGTIFIIILMPTGYDSVLLLSSSFILLECDQLHHNKFLVSGLYRLNIVDCDSDVMHEEAELGNGSDLSFGADVCMDLSYGSLVV